MTETKIKKKPMKIQWEGSLITQTSDEPVVIKNKTLKEKNEKQKPQKITGKINLRVEKKGRAGNPVAILFNFSDVEAKNMSSLKQLCAELKNKLACGGTIDNGEIILMIRDVPKIKQVLQSSFQIYVV